MFLNVWVICDIDKSRQPMTIECFFQTHEVATSSKDVCKGSMTYGWIFFQTDEVETTKLLRCLDV